MTQCAIASKGPEFIMERTALYPGSFDPMTHGHADIIERGLRLFDRIIVGVAVNISKKPLFSLEERVGFLEARFPQAEVEIAHLDGLLVDEAKRLGCVAILRGIRNGSDFDYEFRMTCMNGHLAPELETVFLMADPEHLFVSSSLIKEVARFGGEITDFVPEDVAQALGERLGDQ